jgi:hypothetical protein
MFHLRLVSILYRTNTNRSNSKYSFTTKFDQAIML